MERKLESEREFGFEIDCEFRKSNVLFVDDRDKFRLVTRQYEQVLRGNGVTEVNSGVED